MKRNVYLDAIRALAILLVMLHHARAAPGLPAWFATASIRGYVGVDLFFVLSGWLIGGQLLRAMRRGDFALGSFWVRRWWRTLPAYLAVLAFFLLRGKIGHPWSMLAFFQNYTAPHEWTLSWSLCVEEHFYLLLPLGLLAVRRRPRLAVLGALSLVALSVALRWAAWATAPRGTFDAYEAAVFFPTHLRLDGLMLGVLAAAIAEYMPALWTRLPARSLAIVGVVLVLLCAFNPWAFAWTEMDRTGWFASVPSLLGVSLGVALLLPAATSLPPIRAPWVTWIAEHAFALYLTHVFGYTIAARLLHVSGFPLLVAMLLCAGLCAVVLRLTVERPGLWMRDRLARPIPWRRFA